MADIFDEISKELKQDNYARLWRRYGRAVIGVLALIIIAIAIQQTFSYISAQKTRTAANEFYTALNAENPAAALAEITDHLTPGYQMLSHFAQAQALAESGQFALAEQTYLALTSHTDIAPIYQDMAQLLSVMVAPPSSDADQLIARLAPLNNTANPLQGLSLEQTAALHIKAQRRDEAITILKKITTLTNISESLRQRAQQFLSILNPQQS